MIFSCEKARINEAVAVVSRAAAAKSSLSVLEGILIETMGDKVQLTAYDLDIAVMYSIPAQIEAEGSIVLPAKLFGDIVRKLPDGIVKINSDEKFMTKIYGGPVKFTISGLSPVEYPELPDVVDGDELVLECSSFKNLLKQTVFAAAETDERPVLQGILFDIEPEKNLIHGVAVDGIRLAVRNEPIISFSGVNEKFVIPKKTVLELLKNIPEETDELVVNVSVSHKHLKFRLDEKVIVSRRLEGEFLNYKIAIPAAHNFDVKVEKKKLMSSIERAALLVNPTVRIPIHCTFDYSMIKISATTNMGKFYDEFDVEPFQQTLEVGFNHRMMLDALSACEDNYVRIELGSALEPIVLKPVEGEDFIFLVMPMRLTND